DALQAEINELESLIVKAEQIGTDTKSKELLSGLEQGFAQLADMIKIKKNNSAIKLIINADFLNHD
ncbi:hypothetical protein E2156_25250, partial [Escherichia coli]|uniref:hypothetical protein n=1 Tax=Escherichia coli TaxID=562 RepID=UPI00113EB385